MFIFKQLLNMMQINKTFMDKKTDMFSFFTEIEHE